MDSIVDKIKSFFDEDEWKYHYNEGEKIFETGIAMGNALGNVKIFIILEETLYTVYSVLNCIAEKKNYAQIAEFLHRANLGLKNGNFEMDYNDGEIKFKVFVNFDNTDISKEVIRDSVIVGGAMINKYGIELLKVMIGAGSPQACILEAETLPEDEET